MNQGEYCMTCGTRKVPGKVRNYDPHTGAPCYEWLCPDSPCHNGAHDASGWRKFFGIGECKRCGESLAFED